MNLLMLRSLLLAAVLTAAALSPASATKTITYDHGGNIAKYVVEVNALIASGERVRVDGYCGSACTLHLYNRNTCVTTRATFAFHAASNAAGTRYLMRVYPPKVVAYIKRHGGLTKKLILAKGWEAQKLARPCL